MKFLINPYCWYLLLQFAGLITLQRRMTGYSRTLVRLMLLLSLFLAIGATPLSQRCLETSLSLPPMLNNNLSPALIFVLGGGYLPGVIPDEDILISESQRRVVHGVNIWRHYPDARMIFSGAAYEYEGIRGVDRLVQLMSETAQNRGVPASAVLLEPHSRNTREHPIEALKMSGVTPVIPIGIVTSDWHMRRARREFCRYFPQVQTYPVPKVKSPLVWQDIIPNANTLDANTTLLREWVGMLWYTILGLQGQELKC